MFLTEAIHDCVFVGILSLAVAESDIRRCYSFLLERHEAPFPSNALPCKILLCSISQMLEEAVVLFVFQGSQFPNGKTNSIGVGHSGLLGTICR